LSDIVRRRAGLEVERSGDIRKLRKADSQVQQIAKEKLKKSVECAQESSAVICSSSTLMCETLMVQGLPHSTTEHMLRVLFEQFSGFERSSIDENRAGVAYVTFQSPAQAAAALGGLQGFRLNPTHTLALCFAR